MPDLWDVLGALGGLLLLVAAGVAAWEQWRARR